MSLTAGARRFVFSLAASAAMPSVLRQIIYSKKSLSLNKRSLLPHPLHEPGKGCVLLLLEVKRKTLQGHLWIHSTGR